MRSVDLESGVAPDPGGDLLRLLHLDALTVAPSLLGATLQVMVDGLPVAVRLTEVEAYLGPADSATPDPGSHSYRGRTARNAVMFGPPGHLYVYFTYGMHFCANIVCSSEGTSSAVLLRAGEVVEGIELARQRRPTARRDVEIASGPARLATALGLDGSANGAPILLGGQPGWKEGGALAGFPSQAGAPYRISLTLNQLGHPDQPGAARTASGLAIASGPRVGVSGPGGSDEYPWRFWVEGNPTVSRYRSAVPRRRVPRRV